MTNLKKLFFVCVLSLFVIIPNFAQAASIAKVIAITGGVTFERAGTSTDLALKADLHVNDVIRTNANGKVQFIFNDESIVNIGNNSTFIVEDYSNDVKKSFKANLAVGFARFVSGEIVENNPEAFSVKTPEATVGIRGTTLAIMTHNGTTDVATESSLRQQSVVVGTVIIPVGQIGSFGLNGEVKSHPTFMTPAQREFILDSSSIEQLVISTNVVGWQNLRPNEFSEITRADALGDNNLIVPGTDLGASLANANGAEGTGTGTFEFALRDGGEKSTGIFSFDANLISGGISNVTFNTNGAAEGGIFTVSNGVGVITADSFILGGGNATYTSGVTAASPVTTWNVQGDDKLEFGNDFEGDLNFTDNSGGRYEGGIDGNFVRK